MWMGVSMAVLRLHMLMVTDATIKSVIEALSGELPEQYPEEDTRSCIYGYMGWITKRQKRRELAGADNEKSIRNVKARSKAVSAVPLLCR